MAIGGAAWAAAGGINKEVVAPTKADDSRDRRDASSSRSFFVFFVGRILLEFVSVPNASPLFNRDNKHTSTKRCGFWLRMVARDCLAFRRYRFAARFAMVDCAILSRVELALITHYTNVILPMTSRTGQSQPSDDIPMPTASLDQPTPPERAKRRISQKASTSSAFYGPKGSYWRLVERKYITIVSRYHKIRRRGRQNTNIGKNVVFGSYLVRCSFHPTDMPVQSFSLVRGWMLM